MLNNTTQCPLCDSNNHCAMAVDNSASSCWCQNSAIDKALIDTAKQATSQSCICQRCAEAGQASPQKSDPED